MRRIDFVTIPDQTKKMRKSNQKRRHSEWNLLEVQPQQSTPDDNRSDLIDDPFSSMQIKQNQQNKSVVLDQLTLENFFNGDVSEESSDLDTSSVCSNKQQTISRTKLLLYKLLNYITCGYVALRDKYNNSISRSGESKETEVVADND